MRDTCLKQCRCEMPPDDDMSLTSTFGEEEMDFLLDEFRGMRHEYGAKKACTQWVGASMDKWVAGLGFECADAEHALDRDTVGALAVGVMEVYAIRDAMIMSMIVRPERCSKSLLMDFITRPHMPRVVGRMDELLNEAFEEGVDRKIEHRCLCGIAMLKALCHAVPERFQVHPLAMIAYGLWWMGNDHAAIYALHALALDDECSLAAIVLGAVDRGVCPPRCRRSGKDGD